MNKGVLNTLEFVLSDPDPVQATATETLVFEPVNSSSLGILCAVVQVYSMASRRTNTKISSDMIQLLKREYARNSHARARTAFSMALARANNYLRGLPPATTINMVALAYHDGTAYVSSVGKGVVRRIRNCRFENPLSPDLPGEISQNPFRYLKGIPVSSDDLIILATPQLYRLGEKALCSITSLNELESCARSHAKDAYRLGLIGCMLAPMDTAIDKNGAEEKKQRSLILKSRDKLKRYARVPTVAKRLAAPVAAIVFLIALGGGLTALLEKEHSIIAASNTQHQLERRFQETEQLIEASLKTRNITEAASLIGQLRALLEHSPVSDTGKDGGLETLRKRLNKLEEELRQRQQSPQ